MDEEFPALNPSQYLKTYSKSERSSLVSTMPKTSTQSKGLQENATTKEPVRILNPEHELSSSGVTKDKTESLLTRNAVKLLLEGSLKAKVCRYCLNQAPRLSELDQILEVANNGSFYKIGIKDMVATFHPFKVADDPNFPNKICDKCLDHTIACYKFAQQCDRAERALRNCFEDVYDKLDKLDPLERPKKRGRQKLNPNFNIIQVENDKVIDYAEPVFHLINTCEPVSIGAPINDLECLKCCEVLPNLELLLNHMKAHPKSMWFNCRLCGRSFAKLNQLKKHFRVDHKHSPHTNPQGTMFNCEMCGINCENYYKYLQHIEKHKFKNVMEHLVEKKMDRLCSICLNQGGDMSTLDEIICLHGGCSELAGDRPLYSILASTLPEIYNPYELDSRCESWLSGRDRSKR